MKKSVLVRALVVGTITCASVFALAGASYEVSASPHAEKTGRLGSWWSPKTYRCQECGAPNGGCYYPLCPDCHNKQQDKCKPVPPINPFDPNKPRH